MGRGGPLPPQWYGLGSGRVSGQVQRASEPMFEQGFQNVSISFKIVMEKMSFSALELGKDF